MQKKLTFETKIQLVLNHLQEKGKITSWDAIKLYHATRLSGIIFILKQKGHTIMTEMVQEDKSRYAVYHYSKSKLK